jgi:hypothetical protein
VLLELDGLDELNALLELDGDELLDDDELDEEGLEEETNKELDELLLPDDSS